MSHSGTPLSRGFSLLELIIVMLLLATVMAMSAPQLSGYVQGRKVLEESRRVSALVRYARAEAISQGQIMEVWFDTETGEYGLRPESPYFEANSSIKEYALTDQMDFYIANEDRDEEETDLGIIRIWSDGLIDPESMFEVTLVEDGEDRYILRQSEDRMQYELVEVTRDI